MDNDEMNFQELLAARLRDKGLSLKKLSEATGVAPIHLENMLHGNFEDMPSTPYFRGYVMRLAKVLDFDGEEWWEKIRKESFVKNSGPLDALPRNRFIKKEIPRWLWGVGAAVVIIIIYFALTLPRILGKPTLAITYPSENPYISSSTTLIIQGVVKNADTLYLNDNEEIVIGPDGSWQKTVLLSKSAPNTFKISAKKFLGGETSITEQVLYEPSATSSTETSSSFPAIHSVPEVPATGTFFD